MENNDEGTRKMRDPVRKIYDRQVARCLDDIQELYELPVMVEERIKRAIEYAVKDTDRLNNIGGRDGNTKRRAQR